MSDLDADAHDEEPAQAEAARAWLASELGVPAERIPAEGVAASASDQLLELRVGD